MNQRVVRHSFKEARRRLRGDLSRRLQIEQQPDTAWRRALLIVRPGGFAVAAFRFQDWAAGRGWRVASKLTGMLMYYIGCAEIHPGARIAPGLVLPDHGGVGLPAFCDIGPNCSFTGPALLTIGGMEGIDLAHDRIVIGQDCVIGSNVRIIGAVTLGDATQIRPGSVVMTSFEKPGMQLGGMPARRRSQIDPALLHDWCPLAGRHRHSPAPKEPLMRQSFRHTLDLCSEDLRARCAYEHKPFTRPGVLKMLFNPGVASVMLYRWQVFCASHRLAPLAWLLSWLNLTLYSNAIDSRARIAGGLIIIHANAVFIGAGVKIGRNCLLFHQNSIGFSPFCNGPEQEAQAPELGNDVIVGAGASIYGPVRIGSGSKIAVNAAVDADCPDNSVLFGVPARQVAKT